MTDCYSCKVVKGEIPAHVIYETGLVMAVMSADPITDGNVVIIPKKHIKDIHDLDSETGKEIIEVARLMSDLIRKTFGYDGTTLLENNGAFQDIPHFHMHVFGRHKDNDIEYVWPKGVSNKKEVIEKNFLKLKDKLNNS